MADASTTGTLAGPAVPPPATRIWAVLQRLLRVRDAYSRAKDPAARLTLAAELSDLVDELRALADAVVAEARSAAGGS